MIINKEDYLFPGKGLAERFFSQASCAFSSDTILKWRNNTQGPPAKIARDLQKSPLCFLSLP
jgi:hypothetical protein